MISSIRKLFQPRLAEHIPGQKRVYKNFFGFGKTVRTFERIEETLQNPDRKQAMQRIKVIEESELNPNTKIAVNKINELAASGKPINSTAFIVTDKNGLIERLNASLKSGEASVRYKTSFKNGDFDKAESNIRYNF